MYGIIPATYMKSTDKIALDAGSLFAMHGHIGIDEYNWQHGRLTVS